LYSCTVILLSSLRAPVFCHYWCTHFAWPSYSAVQMKCTLVKKNLSTTTVHSLVLAWPVFFQPITYNRRASIYLLCSDWSISHFPLDPELNHSMLTTLFPSGKRRGKNRNPYKILLDKKGEK
jgi:hypothetical protein